MLFLSFSFFASFLLFFLFFTNVSGVIELELVDVNGVRTDDLDEKVKEADTKTLKHVHVIWRHGERNPWNVLPSDITNGINSWPGGLQQFTRRGMEQNFHLGELIRQRYNKFLSDQFKVDELFVRSSDKDRTLMAAQSTVAGLYPMDRGIRRVDDLNPIPIHTMPYDQDRLLNDRVHCPMVEQEEQLIYKSSQFLKYEQDNFELLEFLGQKSGLGTIPLPFSEIWKVWEPLNGELLHPESHKTPDWLTPDIWSQINHLYDLYSYGLFESQLFRRLRSGPLVQSIVERMQQKLDGNPVLKSQKMYAISAHDSTIAGFLRAFGVRQEVFPLFATALFVELHEGEDSLPFIRLFHRNNTATDEIHELFIPKCRNLCKFDKLKEMAKEFVPEDWQSECQLDVLVSQGGTDKSEGDKRKISLVFLLCIFFATLSILFLVLLIFMFQLYRRQKRQFSTTSSLDQQKINQI